MEPELCSKNQCQQQLLMTDSIEDAHGLKNVNSYFVSFSCAESDGFVLLIPLLAASLPLLYFYEWVVHNAMFWSQYLSCACFSLNTQISGRPLKRLLSQVINIKACLQ